MTEEKRRFSRIVFPMAAEFSTENAVFQVKEIANLSIGGCQLDIGAEIPAGAKCSLLIVLNPADRRMNVDVDGEVIRSGGGSVGVKFTSIAPDDLTHLQNIIRYNSPDPDQIEHEIDDHPGLV